MMARTHRRERQVGHWMAARHRFRLSVAGNGIGPAVVMTGAEAHDRNQALDRAYLSGKAQRVARWEVARNDP